VGAEGREVEPVSDPRFGDPVTGNEVAGLAVAFKALVMRAGGRVEITEAELLAARETLCRVEADPQVMVVEVVEGEPPDVPRFDALWEDEPPQDQLQVRE
jgi:hypothetical protein